MKPLLIAPALLLLSVDTELRLAPAERAGVEKSFRSEVHLEGGDLWVMMGGQEVPSEFLPQLELEITNTTEITFQDRYLRTENGRVLELVRGFSELSDRHESSQAMVGEGMDSEADATTDGESPLEGEHVRFRWDADEEEYTVEFERGEDGVDTTPLEGLEADADFAAFLPEGKVGSGDSWTVPAEAFGTLFAPGGDLAFEYTGDEAEELNVEADEISFKGELELTFRGENTVDGARVASIDVEGEVTVVVVSATNLDRVPVVDGLATQTMTSVYVLEGELVWNLDAGHLSSLELSATVDAEVHLEKDAESEGPTFESRVTLSGEASYAVKFTPAD